jgi:hypothetical protein
VAASGADATPAPAVLLPAPPNVLSRPSDGIASAPMTTAAAAPTSPRVQA